jgi:hypothetical protein
MTYMINVALCAFMWRDNAEAEWHIYKTDKSIVKRTLTSGLIREREYQDLFRPKTDGFIVETKLQGEVA